MNESNLFISETHVNKSENYIICEDYWYESRFKDVKELYKYYKKQGKISNMYGDINGKTIKTGYVIDCKDKYEDTGEIFNKEVWVEVSTTLPKLVSRYTNVTYPFK